MSTKTDYIKQNKTVKMTNIKDSYENESSKVSFIKETYKLFGFSMISGAIGAYLGLGIMNTIMTWFWPLVIAEFILLIGLIFAKEKPGLNLILLFSFTFMTGITSVPLIGTALGMPGGANIIGNAFAMSAIAFASLSYFAIKTDNDYRGFEKPLLFALIGILIVSIINIIFLKSSIFSLAISGIIVIVMSIYTIIDTQNLIKGGFTNPIEAAINLYIDFLNLFINILQILTFSSNK